MGAKLKYIPLRLLQADIRFLKKGKKPCPFKEKK